MNYIKIVILLLFAFILNFSVKSQNSENEFDYDILRHFGTRNGKLDSTSVNPSIGKINPKPISIKYKRDEYSRFDNIKIYPERKLIDVSEYASYNQVAPKLTMKVFSSAPKGTLVEIQLGNKNDDNYPSGIHSQYQAYTTEVNKWEELTFKFAVIPQGSTVNAWDIDKITIVFSPDSKNADTYFFDELKGPPMISKE